MIIVMERRIISLSVVIIISFMMITMTMMTSNHVHCFHDLLHGKARPRPPSHVHLREGSLAFTFILEIVRFSSPPTFWHSCSICHCIGHFYFHFQTQPLELFSGTKTLSWKLSSTKNFRSIEIPSNICFFYQLLACHHWVFHVGDFSGHLGIRSLFVLWWKVFTLYSPKNLSKKLQDGKVSPVPISRKRTWPVTSVCFIVLTFATVMILAMMAGHTCTYLLVIVLIMNLIGAILVIIMILDIAMMVCHSCVCRPVVGPENKFWPQTDKQNYQLYIPLALQQKYLILYNKYLLYL